MEARERVEAMFAPVASRRAWRPRVDRAAQSPPGGRPSSGCRGGHSSDGVGSRRRAAVVVQVAVFSTVMVGMGALALDLGAMYVARTQLQAAADAAALAAAGQLISDGDFQEAARQAADNIVRRNPVMGVSAGVGPGDVEFGRAAFDSQTGRFTFQPGVEPYDAVRVVVRRTEGSEGGPLALGFANIFGQATKGLWARAAAVLLPRDIAVVIDLSGSMNDDSELRHSAAYTGDMGDPRPAVQINLRDVWAALDGPAPSRPYVPGPEDQTEYAGDTGPTVYSMTEWGSPIVPDAYNPTTDPGLWRIPKNSNCTVAAADSALAARGYIAAERTALLSGANDGTITNQWRNRAGVILGLAEWNSGKPGGRPGGNGNDVVADSEVSWNAKPSWYTDSWSNYLSYVASTSSAMYATDSRFRYRFGLKTFVNYALEKRPGFAQTNVLWQTPEQPLQAVKDALRAMADVIAGLDSLDHISLEVFATSVHHEVDLTDDLFSVPERLYHMQAGHYDTTTNIAGGLAAGIAELSSTRARPSAAKIIVLMSDGKPNTMEDGSYTGFGQSVEDEVLARAQQAADAGIRIYTVSVGYDSDRPLMQQIAAIGHGQEFYAAGTPDEYTEELEAIFRTLGGKRPVALIE